MKQVTQSFFSPKIFQRDRTQGSLKGKTFVHIVLSIWIGNVLITNLRDIRHERNLEMVMNNVGKSN